VTVSRTLGGVDAQTLDTGSLWHRGPRLAWATVWTPTTTYEAWTVERTADGDGLRVSWHGNQAGVGLDGVEARDVPEGGWLVRGVNVTSGEREVWRVVRESCGCHHNGPKSANPLGVIEWPQ
jgi:hypothetical protein